MFCDVTARNVADRARKGVREAFKKHGLHEKEARRRQALLTCNIFITSGPRCQLRGPEYEAGFDEMIRRDRGGKGEGERGRGTTRERTRRVVR